MAQSIRHITLMHIMVFFFIGQGICQSTVVSKDDKYTDILAGVKFNFILSNLNDSIKVKFETNETLAGKKIAVTKSYNGSYFAPIFEESISPNNTISFVSSKSTDKSVFYKLYLIDPVSGIKTDSSKIITALGGNKLKCSIYQSKTDGEILADLDESLMGHLPRVIVTDATTGEVVLSKVTKEVDKSERFKVLSGKDKLGPGTYNVSLAFKKETFSQKLIVK
jgi:hypothetical protein